VPRANDSSYCERSPGSRTPRSLGTPVPACRFGTALLVLLEDERGTFEKFGLPTGQDLRAELMLPTEFGSAMRSTHQIKHHLCFNFGCKGSSLYHRVPLFGSSIPPGVHFARCPIPGGHYSHWILKEQEHKEMNDTMLSRGESPKLCLHMASQCDPSKKILRTI
jgi:hypothetical protein